MDAFTDAKKVCLAVLIILLPLTSINLNSQRSWIRTMRKHGPGWGQQNLWVSIVHKFWAIFMPCQALTRWNDSVEAWKKALACLPPQDQFTESDKRLHIQFTEGLQKAENALQGSKFPDPQFFSKDQKMPWQRAEEMIEQLRAEKKESSVSYSCQSWTLVTIGSQGFVIAHAYWVRRKNSFQ